MSQGDPFNPRAIRTAVGYSGGVIFATATPSPFVVHPSAMKFIWKVAGTLKAAKQTFEEKIPVYNEIRVTLFCVTISSANASYILLTFCKLIFPFHFCR